MYVTLEPCSHYGKTPPCARAIVEKGIKRVVVALIDPNPEVAGKGIGILKESGIDVTIGVLEEESKRLNEIFLKYIVTKYPFCILKTAMTLDGKIATTTGDSKWITNEKSRNFVHQLRHRVGSIMVGIGTVEQDNPYLNTRLNEGAGKDPIRIIIDSSGRININSNVLNIKSNARTIVATTDLAPKEKIEELVKKGADIIKTPLKNNKVDLHYLMNFLGEMKIDSVLIEGGSELNYSALSENIVDKIYTFIAPKLIGGKEAKTPIGGLGIPFMKDAISINNIKIHQFDNDIMLEGYL